MKFALSKPGASDRSLPYLPLIAAGSALFAWLMPTHEVPWTSFHAELAMALGALLAGCRVLWGSRPRAPVAVPALALLSLLAALIPIAQAAGGIIVFRGDAVLACLYLLGFALALIVGQRAAEEWGPEGTLETFAAIFLAGALASIWLALYQWQRLDYLGVFAEPLTAGARPHANLNQPNLLATLLVLGLAAAAYLYDANKLGPATTWMLIVLLGFGLAMTQSRAGLLEVGVVAALLIGKRRALGRRLALRHLWVGVPLVLAMPLAWQAANSFTGTGAARGAAEMLKSGTRLIHWESMSDAIVRQPWLGYGWNQTMAAQFSVAADHPASYEVLGYSHNILLDLLLWNGVPVGLAIIAGLGLWFWRALRGARDSATVLALASVGAVFVHALLEYPLYYTYFLLPAGLLMGVISAVAMPRARLRVPLWLASGLLLVAGATVAVVTFDYLALEEDLRSLRFEQARIGLDRPRHELSQPLLLTHLAAFAHFVRTPEREGMSAGELQAMADVVKRFPSAQNVLRYAAALALNGRPAEATEVLRRVCKTHGAAVCNYSRSLWGVPGERRTPIAELPWPRD